MKTGSGSEALSDSCRLFCRLLRMHGGSIGRGRSTTSSNMIRSVPWMVAAASLFVAFSFHVVQAQFCQPLNATLFERCRNKAGYNYTFISNNSDFKEVEELLSYIVRQEISNLDHCSTAADLLVCSMNVPSCVEGKTGPILPCRRLCEDLVHGCEESEEPLFYDELEWIKGMCQFLPNETGDSGNCLEPAGFEPRYPAAETMVQKCSPMVQTECSSLGYNLTTQGWGNLKGIKAFLNRNLKTMMGTDAICAPLMKKIICTQLLPPCYPEEDGRPTLYTACKSDCEALLEKCPKLFQEQLGNLGYCMELGSANKTAHGFCKLTQWPAAGRWPDYVFQVPSTPPSTPVAHRTDAAPHPTHHVSNRTGTPPAPKAARSRSGHHVPLAAILVPAILVSVLMMIAASVICLKRQKRSVTFGKVYRRQRNESDAVEI